MSTSPISSISQSNPPSSLNTDSFAAFNSIGSFTTSGLTGGLLTTTNTLGWAGSTIDASGGWITAPRYGDPNPNDWGNTVTSPPPGAIVPVIPQDTSGVIGFNGNIGHIITIGGVAYVAEVGEDGNLRFAPLYPPVVVAVAPVPEKKKVFSYVSPEDLYWDSERIE